MGNMFEIQSYRELTYFLTGQWLLPVLVKTNDFPFWCKYEEGGLWAVEPTDQSLLIMVDLLPMKLWSAENLHFFGEKAVLWNCQMKTNLWLGIYRKTIFWKLCGIVACQSSGGFQESLRKGTVHCCAEVNQGCVQRWGICIYYPWKIYFWGFGTALDHNNTSYHSTNFGSCLIFITLDTIQSVHPFSACDLWSHWVVPC